MMMQWAIQLTTAVLASGALLLPAISYSSEGGIFDQQITVHKSRTCRCCNAWIRHMRKEGFFNTSGKNENNLSQIKAKYGVKGPLQSCHTAVIDGYIIEGHVPASDIKRLLKERPNVVGLTAPGMPQHSPGMQPDDLPPKGYDVLSFDENGKVEVFQRY